MTFNDVLKQFNKYVERKRAENKINNDSFFVSSSVWERQKATIKKAECSVYIVHDSYKDAKLRTTVCGAQYITTILSGYESELIDHVEKMCLQKFIEWWDVYGDAYIKGKIYDIGGISNTNE